MVLSTSSSMSAPAAPGGGGHAQPAGHYVKQEEPISLNARAGPAAAAAAAAGFVTVSVPAGIQHHHHPAAPPSGSAGSAGPPVYNTWSTPRPHVLTTLAAASAPITTIQQATHYVVTSPQMSARAMPPSVADGLPAAPNSAGASSHIQSSSEDIFLPRSPCGRSTGDDSADVTSEEKRNIRLYKNREAAKECRRKKKEYVRCLESRVVVLEQQNRHLIDELRCLKELYCTKGS